MARMCSKLKTFGLIMTQNNYLKELENESIHIIREAVAESRNPVMLYSIGKDSATIFHLAKKAFHPAKIPFPLMHVDTGMKFPEMYAFRSEFAKRENIELIVHRNEEFIGKAHPEDMGMDRYLRAMKTEPLLDGIRKYKFDLAFGGARREEEKSRAKERVFSFRDKYGQWNPKAQRPELWNLYNADIIEGESIRVFPLSNWTELDIWEYIREENIPVVPIYFAHKRKVVVRDGCLISAENPESRIKSNEKVEERLVRFRSLGCVPISGCIESSASNVDEIIAELKQSKMSERGGRTMDRSSESTMERQKKEGYF